MCYNYVKKGVHVDEIIERWRRAAQRAADERVRIIEVDGRYRATSSSRPLGSYLLEKTDAGWACSCIANGEYGMPCKHLWVLAEAMGLDLLSEVRVMSPDETQPVQAA
jgi:hypothetical protein